MLGSKRFALRHWFENPRETQGIRMTNEEMVDAAYRGVLLRDADDTGRNTWARRS